MNWEAMFVLLLLFVSFAVMVWEKVAPDVVAILCIAILTLTGILTPSEAFSVFGNDAVITVACMFVLSAALDRTGTLDWIGHRFDRFVGQSELSFLVVLLPLVVVLSAFVNNTPVVIVFMPIIITLAAKRNLKPSKLLIPLSFASIFGGCCTLIGTSTNLLVSSTASKLGQAPLGMFELTKIGGLLAVIGIVYLLFVGRRLLPERDTLSSTLKNLESKEYLTQAVIVEGSPLIGKKLTETPLTKLPDSRVLEVIRDDEPVRLPLNEIVLARGDQLRLAMILASVMEIKSLEGVKILPQAELGLELIGAQKAVVVECVVGPYSNLIGRSVKQVDFRRRHGVLILALHRQGENLKKDFSDVELEFGDTLLMEGTEASIGLLQQSENFLLLTDVPQATPRRGKQGIAVAAVALVVTLAAFNVMPIAVLALLGAVMVVLTGCLDVEDAYHAIDWKVLFLIFGMLALGMALDRTGGANWLAHGIIQGLGNLGPHVLLSALFLLASVLTTFLSNNAVAVLLTPIAIRAAIELQVDPRAYIIATALGCSACFASPIGYQTNTLVYGAGGYKFRDFVKVGVPLNILFWLIATLVIPLIWPL